MNENLTPAFKKQFENIVRSAKKENFVDLMTELILSVTNQEDAKFLATLMKNLQTKNDEQRKIIIHSQVKDNVDTNNKAPIFDYDDRYFLENPSAKKEQLFKIQQAILDIEKSDDLVQDIYNLGMFDIKDIETTVSMACFDGYGKIKNVKNPDGRSRMIFYK